ncbi:MAG: beta-glucosidase [Armatimonadetes bacterium 55-13]|nr:beta-glucosidase [Armatimonadota bacterium]OJU63251.1 MAG: beta-glucosidase [Armatimonadetes bacterium 55-13]
MASLEFPKGFLWGAATASYQIEGAVNEGGRGPSVWDTFSHTPGKVQNGDNGDVACDHYHRYPEDIDLMSQVGLQAYRFSIAWPRLLPEGTGEVNQEGIDFYNRLIDALIAKGITPCATLFHWDYPQALHDLGGWTHLDAAKWFGDYAELCFKSFGDRIKFWITHNEPWCYAFLGHGIGEHAPGEKDTELMYKVGHGLILGHGEAVARYRALNQGGKIGITTNHQYFPPENPDSELDRRASDQQNDWMNGWFLDPIYFGDYPEYLKRTYPMPEFTPEQSKLISQPTDFMGLNFYASSKVRYNPKSGNEAEQIDDPSLEHTEMGWMVVPDALRDSLVYSQKKWNPKEIFVTENGCAFKDELTGDRVHDDRRVAFLTEYLKAARASIDEGAKLSGYFVWSFLDNFEWAFGYSKRFGITYVDYVTQQRVLKDSALLYRDIIAANSLEPTLAGR